MNKDLEGIAKKLVEERIKGTRKGSDDPQYLHSFRVSETLKEFNYGDEVVLAGLLHDIIEDSETTFDELKELGFSERTINIINLCTHKDEIKNKDARWTEMIARLITARDSEAWAVKAADVIDNVNGAETMPEDRRHIMREIKAPLLLAVSKDVIGDTEIWHLLKKTEKTDIEIKEVSL